MSALDLPNAAAPLVRRWVHDFFNRHDPLSCADLMAADYRLRVGDQCLDGRDAAYVPAVRTQWAQFPGLAMTVHAVVVGSDRMALHFSEHGASGGPGGRVACWSGVAIYRAANGVLADCVAQEDYLARHRQLKSGVPDPVEAPAAAPWDQTPRPPDPQAEAVVRQWLAGGWPQAVDDLRCDDEHLPGVPPLAFEVDAVAVSDCFSSGALVAFHAVQQGRYLGGLADVPAVRRRARLFAAGIARVEHGRIAWARVVRDRAGLRRALLAA